MLAGHLSLPSPKLADAGGSDQAGSATSRQGHWEKKQGGGERWRIRVARQPAIASSSRRPRRHSYHRWIHAQISTSHISHPPSLLERRSRGSEGGEVFDPSDRRPSPPSLAIGGSIPARPVTDRSASPRPPTVEHTTTCPRAITAPRPCAATHEPLPA